MTGLYTSGDWYAKQGAEQAFVEGWTELAAWTAANFPQTSFAKLLQDQAEPRHFVSFGPWHDETAVAEWRAHPGFVERVEGIRKSLESFVGRTMTVASEIGPATPDPW